MKPLLTPMRKYGQYYRPIARPRLFWLNRDSRFNEEIEIKFSQVYRTALIATTMLIRSSGLGMGGFAQTNSAFLLVGAPCDGWHCRLCLSCIWTR